MNRGRRAPALVRGCVVIMKVRAFLQYMLDHQHRPNTATVIHAILAISTGMVFVGEAPEPGYDVPIYDGPKGALAWTGLDPLHLWGVIFIFFGALTLVSGARTITQFALIALAGAWIAFAASLLWVGIYSADAAMFGGCVTAGVAAGAFRAALQFDRRGD